MRAFKLDARQSVIICHAEIIGPRASLSLRMALDTGATYTMIPVEAAVVIGKEPLRSRRRIEIATGSGVEYVPLVKIPLFKAFGVEVHNMEVVCHTLPPASPVEGLLGLDFLRLAGMVIDFTRCVVEVPI